MRNSNIDPDSRTARYLGSNVTQQLVSIRSVVPGQTRPLRRFDCYNYLHAVYETYRLWKRQSVATNTARRLAHALHIPLRAGVSPIRILIEATYADADPKKKSRWVRALQHAYTEHIVADKLTAFIKSNGGIAGCAARAAQDDPKKWTDRNDWA